MNLNKLTLIFGIAGSIAVIYAVKAGGLWFVAGLVLGMSFMAYSLLSGSTMTLWLVRMTGQAWYLDELRKAADARKKPESIEEARKRQGL